MSWNPDFDREPSFDTNPESIETVVVPRSRDIGDFEVRRALPAPRRQLVGPFIFFDEFGPVEFLTHQGIDIRPHPHIGLATVTYLFRGEFQHRDSLGTNNTIFPGAVNWMIAGRGITHSERTRAETRQGPHELSGVQTWVALPDDAEDIDPDFEHHEKGALPFIEGEGKRVRLVIGRAYGERAPVKTFSDMFYCDAQLGPGAHLPLPDDHEDRGIYVVEGEIEVGGDRFAPGRMVIFRPGDRISLKAGEEGARLMMLGGDTLNGPRYIWWNFVASSQERIRAAKEAWAAGDFESGRFRLPPDDDDEFIPLPR